MGRPLFRLGACTKFIHLEPLIRGQRYISFGQSEDILSKDFGRDRNDQVPISTSGDVVPVADNGFSASTFFFFDSLLRPVSGQTF